MKKVISFILVLTIVFSLFAGLGVNANAASYPFVIGYDVYASVGEDCTIAYHYYPSFKNEELVFRWYDPNGRLIFEGNKSYYHPDSMFRRIIFYTMKTDNLTAGTYKIEVTKNFYSYYAWHTAPSVDTNYIFLSNDRNIGAADRNIYKGSAESFLNLSNETVTPTSNSICYASSAWNRNYIANNNYYIQLQEMYLGEKANTLLGNENTFNPSSNDSNAADQWVFMKYHIENRSNQELDVSDILYQVNFYKYSGKPILVTDTATISDSKNDIFNTLAPGAEDDFWLALLIPNSNGMPYLGIKNGNNTIYLNTNPNVLSGLKKYGHTYTIKDRCCPVCGAKNPDYNAALNSKLTLKHSARTANAVKVTWNNVKTATGYQVQISNAVGNAWATYATLKSGVNAYTFKNLTAGGAYKFRVRFYIKTADGKTYYNPWSAALTSPTLPVGTTLTKLTPAKRAFVAQWKYNKAVNGYQVQYSLKSNFAGAKTITIKNPKLLKATAAKLYAGKYYFVRIRTYKTIAKANYFSTWSKTYKVKTK